MRKMEVWDLDGRRFRVPPWRAKLLIIEHGWSPYPPHKSSPSVGMELHGAPSGD